MNERVVSFGAGMYGILTSPSSEHLLDNTPAVIFLNADPVHNRINVSLCRHIAGLGISSFRFDLSGSGDSILRNDNRPVKEIWIEDIIHAMDHLATELRVKHFVILGICKGARVAAEVAMRDPRVLGIVPINFDSPANIVSKWANVRHWINPRWWTSYGLGRVSARLSALIGIAETKPGALPALHAQFGDFFGSDEAQIVEVWQELSRCAVQALVVFSEFDRHHDFFREKVKPRLQSDKFPTTLQMAIVRNADHNMTAVATQKRLRRALTDWILQLCKPADGDKNLGITAAPPLNA